jgi:hypothetical protein
VGDRVSCEVRLDIPTTRTDERADQITCARGQYGKTARTGTSKEPNDHGFGAIVGVVPRRENACPCAACRFAQNLVSGVARSRLKVAPGGDADPRASHRHLKGAREVCCQVELGRGVGAQPMINAVRDELVAQPATQKSKHMQESHRVRPPAHCNEQPIALSEERGLSDRPRRKRE